ncbi:hypothetical protein [Gallaecimonas sp. GXIMD4217]|uniref:hypothetical protein n=1 Tax=Gallaecimonas sp. GXIMD4217 TaxID=3131927 RepID=UPI00311AE37E
MNMDKIQIGIDLATSITIIISLIALVMESRRRVRQERQKGIDQHSRTVAASQINKALERLSKDFIFKIVDKAQRYESRVDVFFEPDGQQLLVQRIEQDAGFVEQAIEDLNGIRQEVGDFFEHLHDLKYTAFPVLDALPGGSGFIDTLKKDIADIATQYNQLGGGHISLLRELKALVDHCAAHPPGGDDDQQQRLMQLAHSILIDEDYLDWVQSFVPDGQEPAFEAAVREKRLLDENELFLAVLSNLVGHAVENPGRLYAQVLAMASRQVYQARYECKDVLCNLSAIAHMLLVKDGNERLDAVIERYKSEDYLALEQEVR